MADNNPLVASVVSAFDVLESLVVLNAPTSLGEIALHCKRPKSTVHRMLSTLKNMGYVEQDAAGLYHLSYKVLRLGMEALSSTKLVRISRIYLERLARSTKENAYLSVLDSNYQTIYLAKEESLSPVQVNARLGVPTAAWQTATGWVMLAHHTKARDFVLSKELSDHIPSAISEPELLKKEFIMVKEKGYAVTRAQGNSDTGGIAAPIYGHAGAVIAACSIAVPLFRMDKMLIRRCTPLVVQTASLISRDMGMAQPHRT